MANLSIMHLICLFDELSENLCNNDVEKLITLCRPFVPPEELRKINNAMDFLSILWNSRLIDIQHVSFLKGLIKNLDNPVLAKVIESYESKYIRKRHSSLDTIINNNNSDGELDVQQIIQQFKNHKIESNNDILHALTNKSQIDGLADHEFSSIVRSSNYYRARNSVEDKSQPLPCQRAGSPIKMYIGTRTYNSTQQAHHEDLSSTVSPDVTKLSPSKHDEIMAEKNAVISAMQQELIRAETANISQENTITALCQQINDLQQQLHDLQTQLATKNKIITALLDEAKNKTNEDLATDMNEQNRSTPSKKEHVRLGDSESLVSGLSRTKLLIKQSSKESVAMGHDIILTINNYDDDDNIEPFVETASDGPIPKFIKCLSDNGDNSDPTPFHSPTAVAANKEYIYVVDAGNTCVHIINKCKDNGSTISPIRLRNAEPKGVAVTQDGFVVITYCYHNVNDHKARKYTQTGTFISLIALHRRGRSENKPQPAAISAYLHKRLLVIDESNRRVQMLQYNGDFIREIGFHDGQLNLPTGIAYSSDGLIYVSDTTNHCIKIFDPHGMVKKVIGSYGEDAGQFNEPQGISIDSKGNIVVADSGNNRIQVLTPEGRVLCSFGGLGRNEGCFNRPCGITIDNSEILYVTDKENKRVQLFQLDYVK